MLTLLSGLLLSCPRHRVGTVSAEIHVNMLRIVFAFTIVFSLAACGGGGSGGEAPPNFETNEYFMSGGLDPINASAAYEEGYSGEGITVAVIGSLMESDHPDLAVNGSYVASDSGSYVSRKYDSTYPYDYTTQMGGLIAARKNDSGIHGVAYMANLLSINYASGEVAAAFRLASGLDPDFPRVPADVILPAVNSTIGTAEQAAIEQAVAQDALIVVSAGSTWRSTAADEGVAQSMIVVGGVNESGGGLAYGSAGDDASIFLVAPGYGLTSTDQWVYCAPLIGCYVKYTLVYDISGDGYAAALVAGAAAVVKSAAPHLTGSEIADILLGTATDMYLPGVDTTYGHGMLNLAAAIQPVGTLSVPLSETVSDASADLATTRFALGPAFGDALTNNDLLGRTVALDDYDRTYTVGLDGRVTTVAQDITLSTRLLPNTVETVTLSPWDGVSLSAGLTETDVDQDEERAVTGLSLGFSTGPRDSLYFVGDGSPHPLFAAGDDSETLFANSLSVRMPQFSLAGQTAGAAWKHDLNDDARLTVGWFLGERRDNDLVLDKTALMQALLSRHFGDTVRVDFGVGVLREYNAALASQPQGAFGHLGRTDSGLASLTGHIELTSSVDLDLSYTRANADLSAAEGGLLGNWTNISADSASLSLTVNDFVANGDNVGIMISQPLRVSKGAATLTAPIARDMDGNLVRESERVNLSPSGRELDLDLVYRYALSGTAIAKSFLQLRHEPGHDRDAPSGAIIGARLDIAF